MARTPRTHLNLSSFLQAKSSQRKAFKKDKFRTSCNEMCKSSLARLSGLAPSNLALKKLDWPPNRGSTYQIPVLIEGPTSLGDVDELLNAPKVLIRRCVGMPIWNRVRGDEVKVMGSFMIS